MTMTCGRARRLLWPDAGPRAASDDVVAAQAHLAQCEACRRFMGDMQMLSQQLHDAAPRPAAPPSVRNRLYKALAEARTARRAPSRRLTIAAWAAAAAIIMALSFGVIRMTDRGIDASADPIATLTEDHARALGEPGIVSGDSEDVTRWLASRLPFGVYVPVFQDATLRGARLCLMDGRRGAVVEYESAGQTVSYFIVPSDAPVSGSTVAAETRDGYRVASWREPGLLHAFVGSVPEALLIKLAHECRAQVRALATRLVSRLLTA